MKSSVSKTIKNVIFDVDGVLTDGKFHYSTEGKVMKVFGADDSDGLSLLKSRVNEIHMVTGDKRGFAISKKRIDDMKFPLHLVSTFERVDWIKNRFKLEETIYVGDGIFDFLVFRKVAYSIAPANAFYKTKKEASFVTKSSGASGAVAEACIHILENFFDWSLDDHDFFEGSGSWNKKKKNI
ncbi:HAD hydrolase family protein [Patescibacteria group bacterium]|nr:HAD hydrolase family protein [Patescibacteria group bacterium]